MYRLAQMNLQGIARIVILPAALRALPESHSKARLLDVLAALAMLMDITDLLERLLDSCLSVIAGRSSSAYTPRPTFTYVNRVKVMWEAMRPHVLENFSAPSSAVQDHAAYFAEIEGKCVSDTYHSLSIEGYRVSEELIKRVASGIWKPDIDEEDRKQVDALAARGYWQAFQEVKKSVEKVLSGENPGKIIARDHGTWYRELFGPSVGAGILTAGDLAGYRDRPVHIKSSMHTPPRHEAVVDLLPAFFELLENEEEAAARVVLGHLGFVYIHPYIDGNGRRGRFLMNLMVASGGYPWTIVTVEKRTEYMKALEAAGTPAHSLSVQCGYR